MRDQDQSPEEPVTFNTPRWNWKPLHQCQALTCDKKNQGGRYLDFVPVCFFADNGSGHNKDLFAKWWKEQNDCASFACSVTRSTTKEFQHNDIMMMTTV